jgi:hypothetical protein
MDIARIFNNIPDWKRGLSQEQCTLINKLMDMKNAKSFSDIVVEDVRSIQKQMLRSDDDVDRINDVKHAAFNLKPVCTEVDFI